MSDLPPAGWYPDPEDADQQRYWDGSQWTEHRAPAAGTAGAGTSESSRPEAVGTTGTPAGSPGVDASSTPAWGGGSGSQPWGASGSGGSSGSAPDTWLWQSIVATLFCCLPAGVVGIVFAAQANSAVSAGDYALARTKAQTARTWTLVSVGVGVLAIVVGLAFVVLGAASSGEFG